MMPRNKVILFICSICFLGLAIYWQVLNGSFQFDDYPVIVHNPVIRTDNVMTLWNTVHHPTRFITYCTFTLNYHFHQLEPFGYHLVNVFIHLANTFLVFLFVQLICLTPKMTGHRLRENRFSLAVCTALLFLTHPLQTQSVSYITQRFTSLAVLFYMLSVCFFLIGRMRFDSNKNSWSMFVLSVVCAVLGMMTKQITITLPIVVLLLECMFFKRRSKRFVWFLGGGAVLLLLFIPFMYKFSVSNILSIAHHSGSHQGDWINVQSYALTQPRVIWTYLKLFVWPIHQNLLYDFPVTNHLFDIKTLTAIASLIFIFFIGVMLFNKNRLASFCVFFFFVALLVESTIIPIRHVIFEHRTYLPSISVFLLLAIVLHQYVSTVERRRFVAVIVVGLCCVMTINRNRVWVSGERMWKDVITKSPEQARPYYNLGYEYIKSAQLQEALPQLTRALEINPDYYDAYINRSQLYFQLADMEQALNDINQAIRVHENRSEAYLSRGIIFRQMGQFKAAIKEFDRAIALNPNKAVYFVNRGLTWGNLGLHSQGIEDLNKAIKLQKDFAKAYNVRASLYLALKDIDKALQDYSQAIQYDSAYEQAYDNRAKVFHDTQQLDRALMDLNRLIELNPSIDHYSRRAFILSKLDQWDAAIKDYNLIAQLQPELSTAFKEKGKIYFKRQDYQRAASEFNIALEREPNDASGYLLRGLCHYELKEYSQALADMNKAQSLGYPVDKTYFDQIKNMLGGT